MPRASLRCSAQVQLPHRNIPNLRFKIFFFAHLKRFTGEMHYSVRPEIGSSQEEGGYISDGVTRSP